MKSMTQHNFFTKNIGREGSSVATNAVVGFIGRRLPLNGHFQLLLRNTGVAVVASSSEFHYIFLGFQGVSACFLVQVPVFFHLFICRLPLVHEVFGVQTTGAPQKKNILL